MKFFDQYQYHVLAERDPWDRPPDLPRSSIWKRWFGPPPLPAPSALNPFADPQLSRNDHEVIRITIRANDLLQEAPLCIQRLPEIYQRANEKIGSAEHLFQQAAFAPFWDSIELAAAEFAAFDQIVKRLVGMARAYHEELDQVPHNFPAFPTETRPIPQPGQLVNEFNKLVRAAQCDFRFAMIWEQRKTRSVLIEGFRDMGDAIENLGVQISRSMRELNRSLSSQLEEIADLQIEAMDDAQAHRWRTEEMLNNIQRGRKP